MAVPGTAGVVMGGIGMLARGLGIDAALGAALAAPSGCWRRRHRIPGRRRAHGARGCAIRTRPLSRPGEKISALSLPCPVRRRGTDGRAVARGPHEPSTRHLAPALRLRRAIGEHRDHREHHAAHRHHGRAVRRARLCSPSSSPRQPHGRSRRRASARCTSSSGCLVVGPTMPNKSPAVQAPRGAHSGIGARSRPVAGAERRGHECPPDSTA